MKFLLFSLFCASSSCLSSNQKVEGSNPQEETLMELIETRQAPRIQTEWQKQFLEKMSKEAVNDSHAWALFSYGGWADQGQIMIISNKPGTASVFFVDPARSEIGQTKYFSTKRLETFNATIQKYYKLENFESQAMDGINWEFVHAYKDKTGKSFAVQRVFMNNPAIAGAPEHSKLVEEFLGLRKEFKL